MRKKLTIVHRALLCRKIESLFDLTPDVEKLLSYGPVHFEYSNTLNMLDSDLEILIISGPTVENDVISELSRWLKKKKISHLKLLEHSHFVIIIHEDSLEDFLSLIKPHEFDSLWDDVSKLVSSKL